VIRLSGMAAMLGSVVWALCSVKLMFVQWGEPGSYSYENYEFYNRLLALSLPLLMAGSVGLQASRGRRYGWPGRLGFGLTFAGFALVFIGAVGEFWLFTDQPYAIPWSGRAISYTTGFLGLLVLIVGSAFLSVATLRARMPPFIGAFLLGVSYPLAILVSILFGLIGWWWILQNWAFFMYPVPFALAWAVLGYALWSCRGELAAADTGKADETTQGTP